MGWFTRLIIGTRVLPGTILFSAVLLGAWTWRTHHGAGR